MRDLSMPKLHLCRPDSGTMEFPVSARLTHQTKTQCDNNRNRFEALEESSRAAAEVRNALALTDTMSQRMEDLAREFDCLGFFDSDDGPKAA